MYSTELKWQKPIFQSVFGVLVLFFFLSSSYYDRGNYLYLHLVEWDDFMCLFFFVMPVWFLLMDVFVNFTALPRLSISIDGPLQTHADSVSKCFYDFC